MPGCKYRDPFCLKYPIPEKTKRRKTRSARFGQIYQASFVHKESSLE
jgi:hypothetical protein